MNTIMDMNSKVNKKTSGRINSTDPMKNRNNLIEKVSVVLVVSPSKKCRGIRHKKTKDAERGRESCLKRNSKIILKEIAKEKPKEKLDISLYGKELGEKVSISICTKGLGNILAISMQENELGRKLSISLSGKGLGNIVAIRKNVSELEKVFFNVCENELGKFWIGNCRREKLYERGTIFFSSISPSNSTHYLLFFLSNSPITILSAIILCYSIVILERNVRKSIKKGGE